MYTDFFLCAHSLHFNHIFFKEMKIKVWLLFVLNYLVSKDERLHTQFFFSVKNMHVFVGISIVAMTPLHWTIKSKSRTCNFCATYNFYQFTLNGTYRQSGITKYFSFYQSMVIENTVHNLIPLEIYVNHTKCEKFEDLLLCMRRLVILRDYSVILTIEMNEYEFLTFGCCFMQMSLIYIQSGMKKTRSKHIDSK